MGVCCTKEWDGRTRPTNRANVRPQRGQTAADTSPGPTYQPELLQGQHLQQHQMLASNIQPTAQNNLPAHQQMQNLADSPSNYNYPYQYSNYYNYAYEQDAPPDYEREFLSQQEKQRELLEMRLRQQKDIQANTIQQIQNAQQTFLQQLYENFMVLQQTQGPQLMQQCFLEMQTTNPFLNHQQKMILVYQNVQQRLYNLAMQQTQASIQFEELTRRLNEIDIVYDDIAAAVNDSMKTGGSSKSRKKKPPAKDSSEHSLARQVDRQSLQSDTPLLDQQQSVSKQQSSLQGQNSVFSSQRQPSRTDKKPEKSERIYPPDKKRAEKIYTSGSSGKTATQYGHEPAILMEDLYEDTFYIQKQQGLKKEISATGQFKQFLEAEESEYAAALTLYDTNQKSATGKESKHNDSSDKPSSSKTKGTELLKQIDATFRQMDEPENSGQGRLSANYQYLDQQNKGSVELNVYDKPRNSAKDGNDYLPLQEAMRSTKPGSAYGKEDYTMLDDPRPLLAAGGSRKGGKADSTEYKQNKEETYYYDYYDGYYDYSHYYTKTEYDTKVQANKLTKPTHPAKSAPPPQAKPPIVNEARAPEKQAQAAQNMLKPPPFHAQSAQKQAAAAVNQQKPKQTAKQVEAELNVYENDDVYENNYENNYEYNAQYEEPDDGELLTDTNKVAKSKAKLLN